MGFYLTMLRQMLRQHLTPNFKNVKAKKRRKCMFKDLRKHQKNPNQTIKKHPNSEGSLTQYSI